MENDASREAAIQEFHTVLSDVSYGHCTESVKKFIVQSYVRGARFGSAESCPLEKVTSVFTKRRYRDAWNRALLRKIVSTAVPLTIMLRLLEESPHVSRVGGLGKDAQPFHENSGDVSP